MVTNEDDGISVAASVHIANNAMHVCTYARARANSDRLTFISSEGNAT